MTIPYDRPALARRLRACIALCGVSEGTAAAQMDLLLSTVDHVLAGMYVATDTRWAVEVWCRRVDAALGAIVPDPRVMT